MQAVKNVEFLSSPDVLLVQIARPKGRKKTKQANVPARGHFTAFHATYQLRGAAMYSGSGDNGHYTALVCRGEQFFACDDNEIAAVDIDGALQTVSFKSRVVLLAYERVKD